VGVSVVCPGFISDSGMFASKSDLTGRSAPRIAGVSSPERVAQGVLRAVAQDRAEIIVSPGPIRLMLAINQLFPTFMGAISRWFGITELFREVAVAEKNAERSAERVAQEHVRRG